MAVPATCLSLFSGAGGLDLGLRLAVPGLRTVGYVERDAYAAAVLVARMEDAALDPAPVWDDVATFDGRPWRGVVDLIHGGFPCQDISCAGKQAGIGGARSSLWSQFARIVEEVAPGLVFVENVAALTRRGLDVVLADLAALGFDAEWATVRASDAGAPHRRRRVFVLAHAADLGLVRGEAVRRKEGRRTEHGRGSGGGTVADADFDRREGERGGRVLDDERASCGDDADGRGGAEPSWPPGPDDVAGWACLPPESQPAVCRGVDGSTRWMDRLRVLGNGVVPQQAALAWRVLWERLHGGGMSALAESEEGSR